MIEKAFDVITDFAMLFHGTGNQDFQFTGFSLFQTNNRAYRANMIQSDDATLSLLDSYVGQEKILNTCRKLKMFLNNSIAPYYLGPVGVDMFIYRNHDGSYALNPCVEINLRHTMGMVAHNLMEKHLPSGFEGTLSVESDQNVHITVCDSYNKPYLCLN